MKEIVVTPAAHTDVGDSGGSLAGFSPTQLGILAATAAIERAGISPRVGKSYPYLGG